MSERHLASPAHITPSPAMKDETPGPVIPSPSHSPSPGDDPATSTKHPLVSPSQMILTGSMVGMTNPYTDPPVPPAFTPTTPSPASSSRLLRFHEFQCPLCPRSYAQKCSLYRHMKVHKDDLIDAEEVQSTPTSDGQYKCPFCIAAYTNASSLNVHVRTHAVGYRDMVKKPVVPVAKEQEAIFPCPLCKRVFQRRSRLTVHLNISHRREGYGDLSNGIQDKGSDQEDDDDDEEDDVDTSGSARRESAQSFPCAICGATYTRRTNLNKHLEKRHNLYAPNMAAVDLSTARTEDIHAATKSYSDVDGGFTGEGENLKHVCPFCTFKTGHKYSLYRHMTTVHTDQKDLQEKMVNQVLGVKDDDDDDDDVTAAPGGGNKDEIFPCRFCSRVYMRKCNLTQHLKMHYSGEVEPAVREQMAQYCNDVENEVEDVRRIIEMTKMSGDEEKSVHECAICGLTFPAKDSLITHLKMHERRALAKGGEKDSESGEETKEENQLPKLIPGAWGGMAGQVMPNGAKLMSPPIPGMTPEAMASQGMYVMTQDKDGKTTVHNPQAYMMSHLQILDQVRSMIMMGRGTLPDGTPVPLPPGLPMPFPTSNKRPFPSDDDTIQPKRAKPGPKPGRHWKTLECDPNRKPVRKCSLCPFEISEGNRDGLLQHMAAVHGVSCKLCPAVKFFAKRDFDRHCSTMHKNTMNISEMEQLMVFGEIHENAKLDQEKLGEEGDKSKSGLASPIALPSPGLLTAAAVMNPALQNDALHNFLPIPGFPGQSDMDDSILANDSSRQTCPKCGLSYAQKSSLNRHIRTHHNYSRVEELVKAENGPDNRSDTSEDQPPPLVPLHALQNGLKHKPALLPKPFTQTKPSKRPASSSPQNTPLDLGTSKSKKLPSFMSRVEDFTKQMTALPGVPAHLPLPPHAQPNWSSPNFSIMGALSKKLSTNATEVNSLESSPADSPVAMETPPTDVTSSKRSRRKPQVVKRIVRTVEEEEAVDKWNSGMEDEDDDEWGEDEWSDSRPVAWSQQTSDRQTSVTQPLAALERFCDSASSLHRNTPARTASHEDNDSGDIMDLSCPKKPTPQEHIQTEPSPIDKETSLSASPHNDATEKSEPETEDYPEIATEHTSDNIDNDEPKSECRSPDSETNNPRESQTDLEESSPEPKDGELPHSEEDPTMDSPMTDNNGNQVNNKVVAMATATMTTTTTAQ